ncbi:hypothetical protein [Stenotrophomonas sp. YAU14D1_LEIMI4_1]|nr:hypothetical protein [Stenotrophomonas sp. YAU14D1_LEIMI4_1]
MAQPADCEQVCRLLASIRDDGKHWSRHAPNQTSVWLEQTKVAMKGH